MGMSVGNQGMQSGGRRRRGRKKALMSEINVTPFVDVMLVLLIIFMVSAPLLTVGVPIDLPDTQAKAMNADTQPITVSVSNDGKIYLQETEIPLDEVVAKLQAIAKTGYEERIFVRGDKAADYGTVMKVMARISAAGFKNIGLVTLRSRIADAIMKAGLTSSVALHTVVIALGLFSFSSPKAFDVQDSESFPVDIVPIESITQIQQGDKTAPMKEKSAPVPTKKPNVVPDAQNVGDNDVDLQTPPKPDNKAKPIEAAEEPKAQPEPVKSRNRSQIQNLNPSRRNSRHRCLRPKFRPSLKKSRK